MNVEKPPTKGQVETFWISIWDMEKDYNEEAEWLKSEEEWSQDLEQQEWDEIKVDDVKEALWKHRSGNLRE